MGLVTDLLIADASEAQTICRVWPFEKKWPAIETKRLDNSKFAALAAALGDPVEAEALEGDAHLKAWEEQGPWVFVFPNKFRDQIAAINPDHIPRIAVAWAEHEELRLDGWQAEDLHGGLLQLKEFASQAVSDGKSLLLWMSL